jgi:SAM-dependent methyltransferase
MSARERWNQRYRDGAGLAEPSAFLEEAAGFLPESGRALDLAGGAGRHALWLARRGLDVTLVDVAEVGLEKAAARAEALGLTITTERRDVESDGAPAGPWDVVLSFHYLWRPLFAELPQLLAPGGVVVYCQPTVSNLEKNPRPSARFLLEDGELATLVPAELEVLTLEEGWHGDRHEARLVARRRS